MSKQEFLLLKEVRQRPQSLIKNKATAGNIVSAAPVALSKNLRRQHFISLSARVSEDIFQAQMNEITRAVLGSHKNSPSRYYSNPPTRIVPATHFATSFGTGQAPFVAEGRRSNMGSLDRISPASFRTCRRTFYCL